MKEQYLVCYNEDDDGLCMPVLFDTLEEVTDFLDREAGQEIADTSRTTVFRLGEPLAFEVKEVLEPQPPALMLRHTFADTPRE